MTTLSKAKIVEWEEQDGIRKEAQEWVAKANTANVERMRQDTATGITDIVSPVEVDPIWEALAVSRYYAHALRNEAGPPGSWTEEQVIEGERERDSRTYGQRNTQEHGPSTRKTQVEPETEQRTRIYIYLRINIEYASGYNRSGRRNRCRCLFAYALRGYSGGTAGSTRAFLEAA